MRCLNAALMTGFPSASPRLPHDAGLKERSTASISTNKSRFTEYFIRKHFLNLFRLVSHCIKFNKRTYSLLLPTAPSPSFVPVASILFSLIKPAPNASGARQWGLRWVVGLAARARLPSHRRLCRSQNSRTGCVFGCLGVLVPLGGVSVDWPKYMV